MAKQKSSPEKLDPLEVLKPFALIPDDPAKPDSAVLYRLSRETGSCDITCGQIRAARRAVEDIKDA